MAGALNGDGGFVCGMLGSFCSPPRSAPEREGKTRARGWRQLSLNMWMFGSSLGVFRKLFILLVFIWSRVCEPREELGEGLTLGGKEGGEGTAPLSKCLAQEFTQQAADLRTCLNSTKTTGRGDTCYPGAQKTQHTGLFQQMNIPSVASARNSSMGLCTTKAREREYRWREGAAGGREGHCLLVAVGDGKAWVILHKLCVCVCLNRDLWASEVLFEQVNVKVSHVYRLRLERKASQRMLREDRFFVLLFEWWRRNLWNCSFGRLSSSMHGGKYAPQRPQPPQPPPLSGLIQTFSLKPAAALDAARQWCYQNHLNSTEGNCGTILVRVETACEDLDVISSFHCTVSIYLFLN